MCADVALSRPAFRFGGSHSPPRTAPWSEQRRCFLRRAVRGRLRCFQVGGVHVTTMRTCSRVPLGGHRFPPCVLGHGRVERRSVRGVPSGLISRARGVGRPTSSLAPGIFFSFQPLWWVFHVSHCGLICISLIVNAVKCQYIFAYFV